MTIHLADPGAGYLAHRAEFDDAIRRVLESGWYILGPEVEDFERELASSVGREGAVGVGSGTEALHLALVACGVGRGHQVATVSHTATATVAAIELAGATPLFVDVDAKGFTMDTESLKSALDADHSGTIRAIIPVHLYGHPADMPTIMELARLRRILVIEDCAQAHGASIGAARCGSWGDLAAFSFYPTKNLGAFGDGGALVGASDLIGHARRLREYGWGERFVSEETGMNTRLDAMQAAILRVKMRHLDSENRRRQEVAAKYRRQLDQVPLVHPSTRPGSEHVFHQYVVRTTGRDALRRFLGERGVQTGIHYPVPVHLQRAYVGRPVGPGGLLVTERLRSEILSLPVHPYLKEEEIERVCELIEQWSRGHDVG